MTEEEKKYPRVTEILKGCGIIDTRFYKEYNADLGTAVHKACELDWRDTLDQSSLDTPVLPYLEAWRKFLRESGIKIEAMEYSVVNKTYQYRGTVDILGKTKKDAQILVDIKTGQYQRWHGLQLAGYAGCLPKEHARMAVYLAADKTYSLRSFTDLRDKDVFLSALAVHRWRTA